MRLLKALACSCFLLMATIGTADAAALLSVYPTGPGSFTINGSALADVFGMDLTVTYDTPALRTPVVTKGALVAGAFMESNTNNPGEIRLAIISTTEISGSGQIIAITFSVPAGSGSITALTAELVDGSGLPLPVSVTISRPGDCDYNGSVTIAEVQSAINMFLGVNPVLGCVDIDTNTVVSIAEVQKVINGFLGL